jgi:hypothetical protein
MIRSKDHPDHTSIHGALISGHNHFSVAQPFFDMRRIEREATEKRGGHTCYWTNQHLPGIAAPRCVRGKTIDLS